jgi:hypothetical protein
MSRHGEPSRAASHHIARETNDAASTYRVNDAVDPCSDVVVDTSLSLRRVCSYVPVPLYLPLYAEEDMNLFGQGTQLACQ